MGGLMVLLASWIIIGIVVGTLGGMVLRSDPPYGLGAEIGICVAIAILFGGVAWLGGHMLAFSLSFSIIGAVATLWFLRWWKRRRTSSSEEL